MDDKLINKRQVEYLSMAGVFDSLNVNRSVVFSSSSNLIAISQNSQKDRESNQQTLFGSDLNNRNQSIILKQEHFWDEVEILMNEYLSLGFYNGKSIIKKRPFFKNFNLNNSLHYR